jgi:hypothetical protein
VKRLSQDGDYLRIINFFLHGKPRLSFQLKYDAYKAANGGAEPANPQEFFRETVISGCSLSEQTHIYWDNWNNLRMLANMDINDYNVAFGQCLFDLGDQVQGEWVKIEKYHLTLQFDMSKAVCTFPQETCWEAPQAPIEYCSLQ